MPTTGRRRSNPYRKLIHLLNQRYHREWLRAEQLQRELAARRWLGPLFGCVRALKRLLLGARPADAEVDVGTARPVEELPSAPACRVSIVIPFRDRAELLRGCLRSLRLGTYRNYEVVLVDNGSVEPATRRLLGRLARRSNVRVVSAPGEFNFSLLCNQGAGAALGEYLLFLNNDTEVLAADWIERLLRVAARPEVGVAGATLLYPDGTVQHAGIYPRRADGRWVHAFRGGRFDEAWHGAFVGPRQVPAVTAACLMIARERFDRLNGFDERFPLTGNDVDLCCRAQQRGWKVVVTPHARLIHYECLSRGHAADRPAVA